MRTRLWSLALVAVVYAALTTHATSAASAVPGSVEAPSEPLVCETFDALGGDRAALLTTLRLYGDDERAGTAAADLVGCAIRTGTPAQDDVTDLVCAAAAELSAGGDYADARRLIAALRNVGGMEGACGAELLATKPLASSRDVGTLWNDFVDTIAAPLAPLVAFVVGATAALIVLARLSVLLPWMRDRRSRIITSEALTVLGMIGAVGSTSGFALRGVWLMRDGGPPNTRAIALPDSDSLVLLLWTTLRQPSAAWYALALVALLSVWALGKAFATRLGIEIECAPNDSGSGLDKARLMVAVEGMTGKGSERQLEYPGSTSVTAAAESVREISEKRVVAALQALIATVFSQNPWKVTIENESEAEASVTITRNGTTVVASRLSLETDDYLRAATRAPQADRLAALIAAELIIALGRRYYYKVERELHGASSPKAIAYHWIATRWYGDDPKPNGLELHLLRAAVAEDPTNLPAIVTLDNLEWRAEDDESWTSHEAYLTKVRSLLEHELPHLRVAWPLRHVVRRHREQGARGRRLARAFDTLSIRRVRADPVVRRLLDYERNASVNLQQARDNAGLLGGPHMETTYEYLLYRTMLPRGPVSTRLLGPRRVQDPPAFQQQRRVQMLAGLFRRNARAANPSRELDWPMTRRERAAWADAPAALGSDARLRDDAWRELIVRAEREQAVLSTFGRYGADPKAAYSVACMWAARPTALHDPILENVNDLLRSSFRRPELRRWAQQDPELRLLRDSPAAGFDVVLAEAERAARDEAEALRVTTAPTGSRHRARASFDVQVSARRGDARPRR